MTVQRPDNCEHCGYDLTGLPDLGRCPECGQSYSSWADAGRGGPRHADQPPPTWWARHHLSLRLFLSAPIVLLGTGCLSVLTTTDQYVLAVGGALGFLLLLGAVISYLFERLE